MRYRQLTHEERYQIARLLTAGHSLRGVATLLARSAGTICRELQRNREGGSWEPRRAQRLADQRRRAPRHRRISRREWRLVERSIRRDWSPAQVSGRLRLERGIAISAAWIYRRIWLDAARGGDLHAHLRRRRRWRKRYGKPDGRGQIPGRISIERRPAIVQRRRRLGDWEGDTIQGGAWRGPVLLNLVERKSRAVRLSRIARRADALARVTIRRLRRLPARTLTVDNGKEFTSHRRLARGLRLTVYFAHPYRAWERGTNENLGGLVRQYFPKKMSLEGVTHAQVRRVERLLNRRPRACLGWRCPEEVLEGKRLRLTA
jgi:IS30 family transposase